VSIIILALNEEKVIARCLDSKIYSSVFRMNNLKVIVVDNGSDGPTLQVVRSFISRLISRSKKEVCYLRFAQSWERAKAARHKSLAFLDADCLAPSLSWLDHIQELGPEDHAWSAGRALSSS